MTDIKVCSISEDLQAKLKKFRYAGKKGGGSSENGNSAVIMKIDFDTMTIVIENELEGCSVEDLASDLPEFSPRYIAFSYCHKHDDGRVSYPLMFIHYCPAGVKPEHNMIYAGSKLALVSALQITKVFEIRSAEDLTEDWLLEKLGFFR